MNSYIQCPHCNTVVAEITPIPSDTAPVIRRQTAGPAIRAGIEQLDSYLAERADKVPWHRTLSTELRQDCNRWSAQRSLPFLSDRAFGTGLQAHGIEQVRSNGHRYYVGVKLR